jgi:hypothetical protein
VDGNGKSSANASLVPKEPKKLVAQTDAIATNKTEKRISAFMPKISQLKK